MKEALGSPENVVGKVIAVAIVAYILIHFNYEISQYLMSRWDVWWDVRGGIFSDMERAGDDAGILGSLILLILWIVLGLISALLLLVIAGAVWIMGKLNELYVLPFMLAVLVVYSKFSFAFIAKPFGRIIRGILNLLQWAGRALWGVFRTFVLLPLAEVVSGDQSPAYRAYRVATSLLFMVGAICLLLGVGGVAAHYAKKYNLATSVESAVGKTAERVTPATFKQEQYQIEFEAAHPHWTSTGVTIKRGDEFSITARGQVKVWYPGNYPGQLKPILCAPEGMRNIVGSGDYMLPSRFTADFKRRGYSTNNFILPDKPLFGLMGQIGTAKAFYVGASIEERAEYDGELLLAINQKWLDETAWLGNEGTFQVTIVVKRR